METDKQFAFLRGWQYIAPIHREKVKAELMAALNITSDIAFNQRRRGLVEPKVSEAEAIRAIFRKYGVDSENVWGVARHENGN